MVIKINRDDLSDLEHRVAEAACEWRERGLRSGEEFAFGIDPLLEAVDALITARDEAEAQHDN